MRKYLIYLTLTLVLSSCASTIILDWPTKSKKVNYYFNDFMYPPLCPHPGIDFYAQQGDEIYAAANGVVYYLQRCTTPECGAYILVKHQNDYQTVYYHLSKILVQSGQIVKANQLIALCGGTPGTPGAGLNTGGPHLHFELIYQGRKIDPIDYFKD